MLLNFREIDDHLRLVDKGKWDFRYLNDFRTMPSLAGKECHIRGDVNYQLLGWQSELLVKWLGCLPHKCKVKGSIPNGMEWYNILELYMFTKIGYCTYNIPHTCEQILSYTAIHTLWMSNMHTSLLSPNLSKCRPQYIHSSSVTLNIGQGHWYTFWIMNASDLQFVSL